MTTTTYKEKNQCELLLKEQIDISTVVMTIFDLSLAKCLSHDFQNNTSFFNFFDRNFLTGKERFTNFPFRDYSSPIERSSFFPFRYCILTFPSAGPKDISGHEKSIVA